MLLAGFKLAMEAMVEELSYRFFKEENEKDLTQKNKLDFIDSYSNLMKNILVEKEV